MTPLEVVTFARQQYNAVGDTFFSDPEMYSLIKMAQTELATKAKCIERVYSTTTVAGTQTYDFPTLAIEIKRVTYDGYVLEPITFREDDLLTAYDQATTSQGSPRYVAVWNRTLYLRPIPDSALTLLIQAVIGPDDVSATSTLDVPALFHIDLADFLLWKMAVKDKNWSAADYFKKIWDEKVEKAQATWRKHKRAAGFAAVPDVEGMT
jgi:hypothetical protein